MIYLKTILLLSVLLFSFSGCALYHHYGPYYGKVVDAETKQPLEGAVVLANYVTWLHASPGGPAVYFLDAQEVVTDKNGEFRIPSLNAFAFRPISTFEPYPYFLIFKPQYGCYPEHIKAKPIFVPNYSLPVDKNVTVELPKLITKEERIGNHCFPTSVPKRKMKKFIELQNIESIDLGLQPLPADGE